MIAHYPPHYKQFQCIAGKCPDSCCIGWDVVVDPASAAAYEKESAPIGEHIRSVLRKDEDGDFVFSKKANGNCPFLNRQNLCEIQCHLGEEALCDTCRCFPRITQEYEGLIEHDLSITCPEAARMLFSLRPWELQLTAISDDTSAVIADPQLQKLLSQREQLFASFKDISQPAVGQISACLRLSCQWEQRTFAKDVPCSSTSCLQFLTGCSILQPQWRSILNRSLTGTYSPENLLDPTLDKEIRAFAWDFLYRHYLQGISDDMASLRVQMMAFAVLSVLTIICHNNDTPGARTNLWRQFVKEIEYDAENLTLLEETLCTDPEFSCGALAAALELLQENPTDFDRRNV